jgi:hypothetical protein
MSDPQLEAAGDWSEPKRLDQMSFESRSCVERVIGHPRYSIEVAQHPTLGLGKVRGRTLRSAG